MTYINGEMEAAEILDHRWVFESLAVLYILVSLERLGNLYNVDVRAWLR